MDPTGQPGAQEHHQMLPYDGMTGQQGPEDRHCTMPRASNCPFPHFAMIYIDNNGELGVDVSSSLAGCERAIFTEDLKQSFVRAVTTDWQPNMQNFPSAGAIGAAHGGLPERQPFMFNAGLDLQSSPAWFQHGLPRHPRLIPCEFQTLQNKRQRRNRKRTSSEMGCDSNSDSTDGAAKRTAIRIGQTDVLRQFYEKAFENLQQLNCRVIAKAFVKLVEPRKQVNHPYNGCRTVMGGPCQKLDPELTKPKWWPTGVQHKEPDHLLKHGVSRSSLACYFANSVESCVANSSSLLERIRLLMHILCELRESHAITAQKLREAGQDVHRQIGPPVRRFILDEIYEVREIEELYLSGKISGDTVIYVSSKHLPEGIEPAVVNVNEKQNSDADCLPLSPVSISRTSSVESGLSSLSKGMILSINSSEQTQPLHTPAEVSSTGSNSVSGFYAQHSMLWNHGTPRMHAPFNMSSN
ncbi:DUF2841 domain-containing protein [Aspergillus thermomutatus]|uniref:Subtelomeric hrmA-associated cluster protein AFUB-079030/YDR124W-like helical bundle domain-containing protein n=1 Tax=Aspergillus thermomutatus TaxID=41047 RepID=A0A397HQ38_ASPTH|nr:uncharacterized protein CDV56_103748 [Aspergillus thermomutatus]RHZ65309.1 hypothetical protein CDV56_103748 [Aspergillus thermomutatus]